MDNMEDLADEETRVNGLRICQEFLARSWLRASFTDFRMERIRGGLSNMLYLCSLRDEVRMDKDEHRCVLIRFYGQIIQDNPETVLTDSVIFALLAEKGMGPQLYGVFTGGRVEEYVPSRVLRTEELHKPEISVACAVKMAQFHKLTMPIVKEPRWLFDTMTRYLDEALNNLTFCEADEERRLKFDRIMSYNLPTELDNLKSILRRVHSPVVFCHNDLQEGNILYVENKFGQGDAPWQVRPIDFEYSSYNYRGFDIGNHFCEWCYDYKCNKPPHFIGRLQDYPTKEKQLVFIRAYLDEYHSTKTTNGHVTHDPAPLPADYMPSTEEQALLVEISAFALASHFLWALWATVQAHISDIEFGYLEYALARFDAYFKQRDEFLEENGGITNGLSISEPTDNH